MRRAICRAICCVQNGGGDKAPKMGERCNQLASHPLDAPQLCWTHSKALANRNRRKPLQLVPLTLAEHDSLLASRSKA